MSRDNEVDEALEEARKILTDAGLEDVVIVGRSFTKQVIDITDVGEDFDRVSQVQGALSQASHRLTINQMAVENSKEKTGEGDNDQ